MSRSASASRATVSTALLEGPSGLVVAARLVAGLMVVVAVALVVTPWRQTVRGQGRVVAWVPLERQQELEAPIEGRITRWHVHEGSVVRRGELLLEISDNDPAILERLRAERSALESRRAAAEGRVSAVKGRQRALAEARSASVGAAARRVEMATQRARALERAQEAAEAAEKAARLNAERQQALSDAGLAPTRSQELAEAERVRAVTESQRARAAVLAALEEVAALELDRSKVAAEVSAAVEDARATEAMGEAEIANAAAELARLDVRLARQSTMEVRAPLDGTVLRLRGGVGNEFVKPGDPVVTLVPVASERVVELWVDGNDLPLVFEGRPVRLQFEGWPAVQFSGWPSVAVGTFGGEVSLVDAAADATGRFRVVVRAAETWPEGRYLRQGVRANGWLLLDEVRLGYELWRQLNGFPPTIAAEPEPKKGGAGT